MTTLREAAEQALNFLDNCDLADSFNPPTSQWGLELREALRTALAEQPVTEPVAYEHESGHLASRVSIGHNDLATLEHRGWRPLYAAPPREPARLTMEDIDDIAGQTVPVAAYRGLVEFGQMSGPESAECMRRFAHAVEAAVLKANWMGEKT